MLNLFDKYRGNTHIVNNSGGSGKRAVELAMDRCWNIGSMLLGILVAMAVRNMIGTTMMKALLHVLIVLKCRDMLALGPTGMCVQLIRNVWRIRGCRTCLGMFLGCWSARLHAKSIVFVATRIALGIRTRILYGTGR